MYTDDLSAAVENVSYPISNFANASAILWEALPDVNWVGFYIRENDTLLLGPFQGKVACTKIAFGKGVCGTAALYDRTERVDNVHEFSGHIACDSASNSEIVIPIHKDGKVYAVLDIDSPLYSRFSDKDEKELTEAVKILEKALENHPSAV